MVKEHRCHLLAEQYNGQQENQQNIAIYFDSEAGSWQMMISRLATSADLEENHYLQETGELIYQTILPVSYCPYCGDRLSDKVVPVTFSFSYPHVAIFD